MATRERDIVYENAFQDGGKHAPLIPVGRARQALKCVLRPGGNTLKPRYR